MIVTDIMLMRRHYQKIIFDINVGIHVLPVSMYMSQFQLEYNL